MRGGLLAAALAAGLSLATPPRAEGLPAPVGDALARAGVPLAAVGAVVVPVEGSRPVVLHHAAAPMNPASVMKLFTAYAALDLLGPAFTFHTDAFVAGRVVNGVLEGNLHIRGGGDPQLTYERLWRFLGQVRARGVREVRGDLVIDRGYFAPAPHDPAGFDGEGRRAYNVGADALLVNFNVVNFRFVPEAGGVRVTAEPDLPNVEIATRLQLTSEPCHGYRAGIAHEVVQTGLLAHVTFSGTYPVSCGDRSWALAVLENTRFTEAHLRWLWSAVGGVLGGGVREGPVPDGARLLHRQDSEPLAALVRDMNKHSSNVMARHLFLALSAEPLQRDGNPKASMVRIRDWLGLRRIAAPELVMENGSGLSRHERASAATLAALLKSAWASPLMPEFVASLPIYAVDGTLKTRRGAAAGHAHLKGGTLNEVQSVAGYVLDREGRRWIVVMTINHPRAGAAQPAIDALVEWTFDAAHRAARGRR